MVIAFDTKFFIRVCECACAACVHVRECACAGRFGCVQRRHYLPSWHKEWTMVSFDTKFFLIERLEHMRRLIVMLKSIT